MQVAPTTTGMSHDGAQQPASAPPEQRQPPEVPPVLLSAAKCQNLAQQACEMAASQGHQPRLTELLVEPTWKVGACLLGGRRDVLTTRQHRGLAWAPISTSMSSGLAGVRGLSMLLVALQ